MHAYKFILTMVFVALPVAFATSLCLSQTTTTTTFTPTMSDLIGGFGGSYGSNVGYRASTAGEGYARGLADIIRSHGAFNLLTSQAAINATEAVRNDILNRDLLANTYFQMRRENRSYRTEELGPRPTADELMRYAQAGKPKSLSPAQLDAVSGKIYWPRALRSDEFTFARAQLEELFVKRAHYGDISMGDLMKVRELTNNMMDHLRDGIHDIPPMEYISAKQFLASLAYEVQIATG